MVELPLPIKTGGLRLRWLIGAEDHAALHAIQSRADVGPLAGWEPRCEEDGPRGVARRARSRAPGRAGDGRAAGRRAHGETGELVGRVSLMLGAPEHRQAEIGFILGPGHQGRGYATEASEAMLALAFSTYDLHRVYGRLEPRNVASGARAREARDEQGGAPDREQDGVKDEWQSEVIYATARPRVERTRGT